MQTATEKIMVPEVKCAKTQITIPQIQINSLACALEQFRRRRRRHKRNSEIAEEISYAFHAALKLTPGAAATRRVVRRQSQAPNSFECKWKRRREDAEHTLIFVPHRTPRRSRQHKIRLTAHKQDKMTSE